jgi:hypothetical protein
MHCPKENGGCGNTWEYTGDSKARYIHCSICQKLLPNPNFKNPKGDD